MTLVHFCPEVGGRNLHRNVHVFQSVRPHVSEECILGNNYRQHLKSRNDMRASRHLFPNSVAVFFTNLYLSPFRTSYWITVQKLPRRNVGLGLIPNSVACIISAGCLGRTNHGRFLPSPRSSRFLSTFFCTLQLSFLDSSNFKGKLFVISEIKYCQ